MRKFIVFIIIILINMVLFASEGETHHGFDWMGFFGKFLNSLILFGGLYLLLKKPIAKYLYNRGVLIKQELTRKDEVLKETSNKLNVIDKRLKDLKNEIDQMKRDAKKTGETEKKHLEELGKKEAERIIALAQKEIENKIEYSIRRLKKKIADMTIESFKNEISKELKKNDHFKIVEKNIEQIGEISDRE